MPENDASHQAALSPFADAVGKLGSLRNGELTMDNELDVRLGRLEAAIRSQGEQQERVLAMVAARGPDAGAGRPAAAGAADAAGCRREREQRAAGEDRPGA